MEALSNMLRGGPDIKGGSLEFETASDDQASSCKRAVKPNQSCNKYCCLTLARLTQTTPAAHAAPPSLTLVNLWLNSIYQTLNCQISGEARRTDYYHNT